MKGEAANEEEEEKWRSQADGRKRQNMKKTEMTWLKYEGEQIT